MPHHLGSIERVSECLLNTSFEDVMASAARLLSRSYHRSIEDAVVRAMMDSPTEKEMAMQLFQYAVVAYPKDGSEPVVVIEPSTKLTWSEQSMLMLIGRELPDEYVDKIDTLAITIAPFGSAGAYATMTQPGPQHASVFADPMRMR